MTDTDVLGALLDREAIRDCLARYCRGIDRRDEDALRSAYWPDATDRHGGYDGPVDGFVEWAMTALRANRGSVHSTGTQHIDLHGDRAAVETYFMALQRDERPPGTTREVAIWGRYLDEFHRRDDEWRIAHRLVVFDWVHDLGEVDGQHEARLGARTPTGRQAPDDPLYAFLAGFEQPVPGGRR